MKKQVVLDIDEYDRLLDLLTSNNILSEGIRLYRTKYKTEIISAI